VIDYHHIIQLLCLLTGVVLLQKSWPVQFKSLVVLVAVSAAVELAGAYIAHELQQENNWLYNIYLLVQALFVWFIIRKLVAMGISKQWMNWLGVVYLVAFAACYIYHPVFIALNSYAFSVTFIFYCVFSGIYLVDMVSNNVRVFLLKDPGFWFIVGIFLMSVLFICRFTFYDIMPRTEFYRSIIDYFVYIVNTILYGSFILSFLCLRSNQTPIRSRS
jgi:hypothetical protein